MSTVTPDSRTQQTAKLNNVMVTSVAAFAVRFCRSMRRRSPDLVEIDEVGSYGTFRTSNTMVKAPLRKVSRVMFGMPPQPFWNM